MINETSHEFFSIARKFEEFMKYTQRLKAHDTYLIVNRNSPILSKAAYKAAKNIKLNVMIYELSSKKPYKNFPKKLINLLKHKAPKAGISLFNYSNNPTWNLEEVGARINFLHQIIEQIPISWGHSPGITMDMAKNGPIQCDYKKLADDSQLLINKLQKAYKIHITTKRGTNLEIQIPNHLEFDTDCVLIPPNVNGNPGKFGNLPIGEVWVQRGKIIQVTNKETKQKEPHHYPEKLIANGTLVCDVTVGGYDGRINPEKPLIIKFKNGVLVDIQCKDPELNVIKKDIAASEQKYGLPTILEELGIGLNEKARITGNMLEDEKIKGTCHLAPGNIRSHVDMLINKPTITVTYSNKEIKTIIKNGNLN